MSDLISRQAAISHVDDVPYIKEHPNVGLLWKAWIESLPPAQPDVPDINDGDIISRQAAIDAMNGLPKWIDSDHGVCLDYSDVICVLGDTEKLQSAQPEQRWIPVSERLPEAGTQVLCRCRANIYEVMTMQASGVWIHDTEHAYMHSFVTHWMPLP